MFLSRIREAAKASGVEVRSARNLEQLRAYVPGAATVFVDLDSARLPTAEALSALKTEPALAAVPVVGFFSHVHADRAAAAKEAGVARVLARSAFVQELPALVAGPAS
jgi:CheY-like chemotaxis protein